FENGLNSAVNRLREALCDSAKTPRYIETVPRRGYRFIAAIEFGPKFNGSNPTILSVDSPRMHVRASAPFNWKRALFLSTGAFAVLALMPLAAWHPLQRSKTAGISQQLKPVPLITFANGSQWLPAFSPDGSRVAYSWRTDAGWYLEVKEVDDDTRFRLTPHPAEFPPGPAWSPDGHQIAFARAGVSDDRGIFVVSEMGGRERKIRSIAPWRIPQRIVN